MQASEAHADGMHADLECVQRSGRTGLGEQEHLPHAAGEGVAAAEALVVSAQRMTLAESWSPGGEGQEVGEEREEVMIMQHGELEEVFAVAAMAPPTSAVRRRQRERERRTGFEPVSPSDAVRAEAEHLVFTALWKSLLPTLTPLLSLAHTPQPSVRAPCPRASSHTERVSVGGRHIASAYGDMGRAACPYVRGGKPRRRRCEVTRFRPPLHLLPAPVALPQTVC